MGDYNMDNTLLANTREALTCLFNTSYVTDYRYWPSHKTAAWKAPRQRQHYPRISRISYHLSLLLVLNLMYILHLISIDLQLSRSLNSPTLQSLQL